MFRLGDELHTVEGVQADFVAMLFEWVEILAAIHYEYRSPDIKNHAPNRPREEDTILGYDSLQAGPVSEARG